MALCQARKADGTPCQVKATASGVCWAHDPAHAERRKQIAKAGNRAGGKGRPSPAHDELGTIKKLLNGLVSQVYTGKTGAGTAYAMNALLNTQLRVIELERKLKETEELEQRLAALEAAAPQGRHNRWGT